MALNVGELYATLGLNTKVFDTKLRGVDSGLGRIAEIGKKIAKTGLGLGAAFAGTALVTGYKRLTSIQDATAAMTVQLGSATKAADLMNRVLAVSKGTPFSFDQFASASKQLVAFGVSTEKIPGYLRAIGEAAAATGSGSEGLNQIATAFGKMSARGRIYMDDVWQISESGTSALKILANGYGVSTAAMQDMVSKGQVPASKAMDLLTQGIMKGSRGVAGSTRALGGTMDALGKTTSGAMANAKAAVARFGAAALKPVFDRLPGVLKAVSGELDKLGKVVGPALAGFLSSKGLAEFIDRIRKLTTTFLPPLLHDLAQVGKVAAGIVVAGFHAMNSALGPLAKHGEVLVPILEGIVAGFVAFKVGGTVVSIIKSIRAVWMALNAAFAASPIGVAAVAAVALGAALYGAYKHIKPFHDAVDKAGRFFRDTLWPAVKKVADIVGGALVSAWHAIEGPMKTALGVITDLGRGFTTYLVEPIRTAVGVIVDLIHGDFAGAFDLIKSLPGKIVDGFGSIPGQLLDVLSQIPGVLASAFASAGSWLLDQGPKILGGLVDGLVTGLLKVASFFLGLPLRIPFWLGDAAKILWNVGGKIITGLWNGARSVVPWLGSQFAAMPGRIVGFLVGMYDALGRVGINLIHGLWHGVTGAVVWLGANLRTLPGKIVSFLAGSYSALTDVGKNIVRGIWHGLQSMWGWIKDKITGFVKDTIPGPIRDVLHISSPSKVMADIGGYAGEGLVVGMDAKAGAVTRSAKRLAASAVAGLGRGAVVASMPGLDRAGYAPGAGSTPAAMVTDRTGDVTGVRIDKAYFESGLDVDQVMDQAEFHIRQRRF